MGEVRSRYGTVRLGPADGQQVVVLVSPRGQDLPMDRRSMCEYLEKLLPEQAELEDLPYHGKKLKGAWAVVKFAAGVQPYEALKLTLQAVSRIYQALVPDRAKSKEANLRKLQKKERKLEKKRERFHSRMDNGRYRGHIVQHSF